MTRKILMRTAHKIARVIVHATGDYMVALKLSLKYVWYSIKKWNKKRFTMRNLETAITYLTSSKKTIEARKFTFGVPDWLIQENLNDQESYAVRCECNVAGVKRETAKALLISFSTEYGYVDMWTPKSVYRADLVNC